MHILLEFFQKVLAKPWGSVTPLPRRHGIIDCHESVSTRGTHEGSGVQAESTHRELYIMIAHNSFKKSWPSLGDQ